MRSTIVIMFTLFDAFIQESLINRASVNLAFHSDISQLRLQIYKIIALEHSELGIS